LIGGLGPAELVREGATLVMLLAVGFLTGRTWRTRLAYTAIAFGIWDIFYYVFLKLMTGWPHSLLDWDILFLLPLPWWGPVVAPASIALLMIGWGTLVTVRRVRAAAPRSQQCTAWCGNFTGVALALYVFMEDTIHVAAHGVEAVREVLPTRFNWMLFTLALSLLAGPMILEILWLWRVRLYPERNAQRKVRDEELAQLF